MPPSKGGGAFTSTRAWAGQRAYEMVRSPARRAAMLWTTNRSEQTPFACALVLVASGCAADQRQQADLSMINGTTLKTEWSTSMTDPSLIAFSASPALVDLNGDGVADILIDEVTGNELSATETQGVLSGATGKTVWSKPMTGYTFPAGILYGGPGQDLFSIDVNYDPSTSIVSVKTDRLKGSIGDVIATTTHNYIVPQNGALVLGLSETGDMDRDGSNDLMFDSESIDFTSGAAHYNTVAESGPTGAVIATRDVDDPSPSTTHASLPSPAGDLNGDGTSDIIETISESTSSTVNAILMPGGNVGWSRTESYASPLYSAVPIAIGDLDGDGRAEVIYFRDQINANGADQSRFDVLNGSDGKVLWGSGDAL